MSDINKVERERLPEGSETVSGCAGMTLLDHFAGLAMNGFVTNHGIVGGNYPTDLDIALYAYDVAAAMLEVREGYGDE